MPLPGSADNMVSVIMPTYNYGKYIGEAISSVVNQSYQNLELIIIDNYSTDNTEEIVSGFMQKDSRIRYVKFRNYGSIAKSRNKGIGLSRGEYIAFLDSDDRWLPDKLALQTGVFNTYPEISFVYAQAGYMDGQSRELRNVGKRNGIIGYGPERYPIFDPYRQLMLHRLWTPILTVIAKKQSILSVGCFPEDLNFQVEDAVLWARLLQHTVAFFVPEVVAHYRTHSQSYMDRLEIEGLLASKLEFYFNIHQPFEPVDPLLIKELGRMVDAGLFKYQIPETVRAYYALKIIIFLAKRHSISMGWIARRMAWHYPIKLFKRLIKKIA